MESRKEALLKEASENSLIASRLQDKLDELDSKKPRPYGTIHAVGICSLLLPFLFNSLGVRGWEGLLLHSL